MIITDKFRSHGSALPDLAQGIGHRQHIGLNNRDEALHRQTRRREKAMGRFTSPGQAQRLLSVHDQDADLFRAKRHRLSARSYRHAGTDAFDLWAEYASESVT